MDPLQQLERALEGYDFEVDPERIQGKKILSTLDSILEKNDDRELDGHQVPLKLLAYTFNSILFPSFIPEMLPDLLQIITMIEFHRLRITQRAADLLELDTYLKMQPNSQTSGLAKSEQAYFRHLVHTQDDIRQIFLNNVLSCCVLDLKRLWLDRSNTNFWRRWNEYFSILQNSDEPQRASHSFHHKIKPDEIAFLQTSASELSEFMELTVRTAMEQASTGESIEEIFRMKTFREQFIPVLSTEVSELLTYHLDVVLDAIEKIETIDNND